MITNVFPFLLGMKAGVESTEEAEVLFGGCMVGWKEM